MLFTLFFILTTMLNAVGVEPVVVGWTGLLATLALIVEVIEYVDYQKRIEALEKEEES